MMKHVPDESRLDIVPKLLACDLFSSDRDVVVKGLEALSELCYNTERHETFQSMKDNSSIVTGSTVSMSDDRDNPGSPSMHEGHGSNKNKKSTTDYMEYVLMVKSQEEIESNNRSTIRDFGGHLAIVIIMKRWSGNATVQATACKAMYYAAYPYDNNSEAFQDLAVHVGAMEVIINALQLYNNNDIVQLWGIRALVALGWDERNYIPLVLDKANGIDSFVLAMNTFPNNVQIQRAACLFLVRICQNSPEIRETVVKAGTRRVLLAAIENHPEDNEYIQNNPMDSIQRNARQTMKILCDVEDQPMSTSGRNKATSQRSSAGTMQASDTSSTGITSLFKKMSPF